MAPTPSPANSPQGAVYVSADVARLETVPKRIGLIAGEGNFPLTLAQAARSEGVEVTVFAMAGLASDGLRDHCDAIHEIRLSDLSRLIDLCHAAGINHVVMAGRVPHGLLLLKQLALDPRALRILGGLRHKKADEVLSAAVAELEGEGIRVINSTMFLKSCMPDPGLLTPNVRPTDEILKDVEFGYPMAKDIGRLDIGQTIAVRNQIVIGVEALEGTDELILRSAKLGGDGLVIVKVSKPRQDMRFDVPVVGLTTIKKLVEAKAAALCVTARQSLFFDRAESIALAERHNICIVARPDDEPVASYL